MPKRVTLELEKEQLELLPSLEKLLSSSSESLVEYSSSSSSVVFLMLMVLSWALSLLPKKICANWIVVEIILRRCSMVSQSFAACVVKPLVEICNMCFLLVEALNDLVEIRVAEEF